MKAFAALLCVLAVFSVGCSGRREKAQPAVAAPAEPASQQAQDRAITLSPQRPPASETRSSQAVRESSPVQRRDRILSLRGGEDYVPEDYEIGALQNASVDRNIQAVVARIRSFQSGLQQGDIPLTDIHPDWRDSAQRSLGFHLDHGHIPLDVRVGVVDIYVAGKARANLRLIGDPGVAFGEIYLDSVDDEWLVSDFQIDMTDLAEARAKRAEQYEPSVYRLMSMP